MIQIQFFVRMKAPKLTGTGVLEKIALNLQTFHTQSLQLVMAAKFLVVRALRSGGNNVL